MHVLNKTRRPPAMLRGIFRGLETQPKTGTTNWPAGTGIRALHGNRNEANSIVEFALVLPLFLTLITAIWQLGIVYANLIALTQGTTQAAQTLARDASSTAGDPCADAWAALKGAAPNLKSGSISMTITINGGTAQTGNTCSGTQVVEGAPITISATYPYTMSVYGISVYSGSLGTGTITETAY